MRLFRILLIHRDCIKALISIAEQQNLNLSQLGVKLGSFNKQMQKLKHFRNRTKDLPETVTYKSLALKQIFAIF